MRSECIRSIRCLLLCGAAAVLVLAAILVGWQISASPRAVIWAGSDLQGEGRDGAVLGQLLDTVRRNGYRHVDEALFLGDYSSAFDTEKSTEGIGIVCDRFDRAYGMDADDILFLQGNHDPADTPGLDPCGAYERENYIVYMIHEGDFPSYADEDSAYLVEETASALDAYLTERAAAGDDRPIFVMTHVPLHMNWREDNRYARLLVDILNRAGEDGLNLIVLFAHNHSDDYDSYLGGSCVYMEPGDKLPIPDPTAEFGTMAYETVTLQFTYLNAGYVGFTATGEDGEARTCSVFAIYSDRVELTRFDVQGIHDLKNAGCEGILDGGWAPDLSVVPGTITIPLK